MIIAFPNCSLSLAYFTASLYAASANPTDCAPTPSLAPFIRLITYLIKPNFLSPTSCAGALLNTNSAVGEPFIPNLFSILRTVTALFALS